MHIPVGKFEGKEILDAPGRPVITPRELTVKEEIFDLIGASRVNGAEVLDFNDPNGMVGIESLSRGAKNIHFVSDNLDTAAVISENIKILKIQKESALINETLKDFLSELAPNKKFGLIFFEVEKSTELTLISDLVAHIFDDGLLIVNIPIKSGFEIPTVVKNGCIHETRDSETKKVLIISKVCES